MKYNIFAPIAIAVAIWTVTPNRAQGQMWGSGTRVDIPRAIELETEAEIANTDRRRWSRAASLLRQASELRPENDPIALGNLRMAGAIYSTTGQLNRARSTLLELADRAAVFGEVELAANAFMDVAHVADELGDPQSVISYYERAQRLAMSSHLTSEERRRITRRLEGLAGPRSQLAQVR